MKKAREGMDASSTIVSSDLLFCLLHPDGGISPLSLYLGVYAALAELDSPRHCRQMPRYSCFRSPRHRSAKSCTQCSRRERERETSIEKAVTARWTGAHKREERIARRVERAVSRGSQGKEAHARIEKEGPPPIIAEGTRDLWVYTYRAHTAMSMTMMLTGTVMRRERVFLIFGFWVYWKILFICMVATDAMRLWGALIVKFAYLGVTLAIIILHSYIGILTWIWISDQILLLEYCC